MKSERQVSSIGKVFLYKKLDLNWLQCLLHDPISMPSIPLPTIHVPTIHVPTIPVPTGNQLQSFHLRSWTLIPKCLSKGFHTCFSMVAAETFSHSSVSHRHLNLALGIIHLRNIQFPRVSNAICKQTLISWNSSKKLTSCNFRMFVGFSPITHFLDKTSAV